MSSSGDTSEFGGLPGAVLEKSSVKGWVQGGWLGLLSPRACGLLQRSLRGDLRSAAFAAAGLYPSLATRCRPSNSKVGAWAKPASSESTQRTARSSRIPLPPPRSSGTPQGRNPCCLGFKSQDFLPNTILLPPEDTGL